MNRTIVILVCFVIVMALWLLSMLDAVRGFVTYSGWLAFFACLLLGIIIFWNPNPPRIP